MLSFREYLEYSEKYLKKAGEIHKSKNNIEWLLIPSILLSWIAIESFVNNMIDDFNQLPNDIFELNERAFLLEKKLRFSDSGDTVGNFYIDKTDEYKRIEDKIFFLIAKFSKGKKKIKQGKLWQGFKKFKETRDKIVHPKKNKEYSININEVEEFLNCSKEIINFISKNIWGKPVDF